MSGDAEFDREYAAKTADEFARCVRSVADELRELADRIERRAAPSPSIRTLTPDFHRALHDVLHDLTTGLMNCGVDRLPRRALEAHEAAVAAASSPVSPEEER